MNNSASEDTRRDSGRIDALLEDFDGVVLRFARLMTGRPERASRLVLTPPQYLVLKTLDADGPMRISDVASRMSVGNPAASMLLHALSTDGLVTREDDPSDRRVTLVAASTEGRRRLAIAESERKEFMRAATAGLSADELEALVKGLQAIADAVGAFEDDTGE